LRATANQLPPKHEFKDRVANRDSTVTRTADAADRCDTNTHDIGAPGRQCDHADPQVLTHDNHDA
jgi:hypothetical protein